MIKLRLFCISLFLICGSAFAYPATIKDDSLTSILKNKDIAIKKRELILYLRFAFGDMPLTDLGPSKIHTTQILQSFKEPDSEGLILLIDGRCQYREKRYSDAQNTFLKAIQIADQSEDHDLL